LPDASSKRQIGRITFLASSLLIAGLCAAALKLLHAHPDSKRVTFAVGYGMVLAGVFWTRRLDSRLREAGFPRWIFWPYFLVVFTGCIAAQMLKLTNSLETLGLFFLLQLPAFLFSTEPVLSASLSPDDRAKEASKLLALDRSEAARRVTPIGAVEFAINVLLITGLWAVMHLLRADVAGMAIVRIWRMALDAGSVLLCLPWIFSVRGRLRMLGLMHWYPGFCTILLVACVVPFALRAISFQHALVLFAALQIPAVALRRQFIPAGLATPEASEEVESDS